MMSRIVAAPTNLWEEARTAYLDAKAAEDAYVNGPYAAAIRRAERQGPLAVFDEHWTDLSDRLTDIRAAAEESLMDIPAPDGSGLALKYLIAKGGGRDTDKWDTVLEQDALRITAGQSDPHMALLAGYQQLLADFDASHAANPDGDPVIREAIGEVVRRIIATPATTRDGLLAKALLVADLHLSPDDTDDANVVLAEAAALHVIEARS